MMHRDLHPSSEAGALWPYLGESQNHGITESQNELNWKGPTWIIKSKFLQCTGLPQESHHVPESTVQTS